MAKNENDKRISDVGANPQDQKFGEEAAEDLERVEKGQQPEHAGDTEPRPGGKADPAGS